MPMQPRPRAETVRGPRVRWSMGSELLPVDVDLEVDELEVALHLGQALAHRVAVGFEDREALALVAPAGAQQRGFLAARADGHAGPAQLGKDRDPRRVGVVGAAAPAGLAA